MTSLKLSPNLRKATQPKVCLLIKVQQLIFWQVLPKKSLSPYGFLEQIYITSPPLHLLPIWPRRPLQCSCSSSFPASPSTTHPWYSYPFLGFISFYTTVSASYSSPSVLFPHDSPSSFYHHPTPLVASPLPLYPISLFFPISYSSFLPQLPLSES